MRRYLPLTIIVLVVVYLAVTGFQCGSAEATSAKLYIQQKQWAKAEESLLKELSKNEKNEESWFLLGQVRMEQRNFKGMDEAYVKSLSLSDAHKKEIYQNRLAIWAMMYNDGVKYYNVGRDTASYYDKALDAFRTAISMMPDSSSTYYVAALAYYAKKDYQSAQKLLETALVKKPGFIEASRLLGQLHYLLGSEKADAKDEAGALAEYAKAATVFEGTYNAVPTDADNIINLIDAYERSKQNDKALKLTQDAVAKDPNNKIFRYAYGVFLLKQEKYLEGLEQFKKAIEIDPNYVDAIYNCGVAYLNWGVALKQESDRKAEAERKAAKGKEVKEDLTYKEKFKASLPYLEKAAETRQDDAALWQQLGRLYLQLNLPEKSKAAFEKSDKLMRSVK